MSENGHPRQHLFTALQSAAIALDLPHADIEFDDVDITVAGLKGWEEAALFNHALNSLSKMRDALGAAQLAGLWHLYQNEFVVYMGDGTTEYNPKDFANWVRDEFNGKENIEYIVTLSYTVARIFQDVHTAHMANKPMQDDEGDITVERLLTTDGLISRLNTISTAWEAASPENKALMAEATLNAKSRKEVKKVSDEVRGKATAKEWVKPAFTIYTQDGLTDLVFEGLDATQTAFITGLLSGYAHPVYAGSLGVAQ